MSVIAPAIATRSACETVLPRKDLYASASASPAMALAPSIDTPLSLNRGLVLARISGFGMLGRRTAGFGLSPSGFQILDALFGLSWVVARRRRLRPRAHGPCQHKR